MSPLIETVLFVFGLVGLGYLTGLTGYLRPDAGEVLSEFAVSVALPLLLFRTMLEVDFHSAAPWALWGTYFSAVAVSWTAGHIVTTRLFGRDSQAGVVGGVGTAFSNLLLLGIPLILGVFGRPGSQVLSLVISIHLPAMMMASIVLFELFGRDRQAGLRPRVLLGIFARKFASNPLILGILSGLTWRATGAPVPALLSHFVDALANIAGPLALFALGLGLRRFGMAGHLAQAATLSALKLFLMPAMALLISWAVGLPPLSAKVAVAAAALPAGVNSYLIATQFGTGQALASNQIVLTTACAVVTTAFWLSVAQAVFG